MAQMAKSKRKCDNWLETFLEWTLPVSEAPKSILEWSGLFCISSIMKRRVRYAKRLLKKWDVYPTTYIMIVAPPGVAKKSTTVTYAEELLRKFNKTIQVTDPAFINFGPDSGSEVQILKKMSETLDGSMTIIAGEFGNIVKARPLETYDFFTKMFDNSAQYLHDTLSTKALTVLNPSLSLVGCTTPDWLSANSGYIIGGGFTARTVFLFEKEARQRKLFDVKVVERNGELFEEEVGLPVAQMAEYEERLIHDLKIISSIKGEAKPESLKLHKKIEDWYVAYVDKPSQKGEETFKQRKHVHVLRTAMLLSLCERDDLIIQESHFDEALSWIEKAERKLAKGFSMMGRNADTSLFYDVLEYIQEKGKIRKGDLLAYFFRDFKDINDLHKILEVLMASKKIEEVHDGQDIYLRKVKGT